MNYSERLPHPLLRTHIKCMWSLESDDVIVPDSPDRVLPDGCMELIFHFGDPFQIVKKGVARLQDRSILFGQIESFVEMMPSGKTGLVAVRFKPSGLAPFVNIPVSEFNHGAVSIEHVFGKEAERLEALVMLSETVEERMQVIEQFLISRLYRSEHDRIVHSSLQYLGLTNMMSVDQLANSHGISMRQLERKFKNTTGLSPKTLMRIMRFQRFFALLESENELNLTQLALDAGYYDQAHFIRDFHRFAGMSPTQYFKSDNRFANHFVG